MSPQPPPPCCGAPAAPPRSVPAAAATGKAAPSVSPSPDESTKPVLGAPRPHRRLAQTLPHTNTPPRRRHSRPLWRPVRRVRAPAAPPRAGKAPRRPPPPVPSPALPHSLPRRRRSPRGGRCLPGRGHGGLRRGCDRERFHRCPWSGAEPRVCSGRAGGGSQGDLPAHGRCCCCCRCCITTGPSAPAPCERRPPALPPSPSARR